MRCEPACSRRMVAIAALQLPVVHGDVAGALVRLESALAQARDVDLVLLPETALTGYVSEAGDFDLRPYAEAIDGPTATALAELAARSSTAIAGPLIERDGERTFNT